MRYLTILILLPILSAGSVIAQSSPEIKALIDSGRVYYYKDGIKTHEFSRKAYELSVAADDYWGKLNALQLIGEGFFTLSEFDSAMYYFKQAMILAEEKDDKLEIANNYVGMASTSMQKGEYNKALEFYTAGIDIQEMIGDSSGMCDALLRKGNVFSNIGEHESAIEHFLRSIKICEAIGQTQMIGYNYGSLGVTYDKQKHPQQAEKYLNLALQTFEEIEDRYSIASVLNNMGIFYKNTGQYDKSITSYERSLELFREMEILAGQNASYTNLGILHQVQGNHELSLSYAGRGLELAKELNNLESEQDNLNTIARAYLGIKNFEQAISFANGSLKIANELGSLEKLRDVNETLSMIYEAQQAYDSALYYFKQYAIYKDSILNVKRSEQINELQTKYETEKKDREIEILGKNAELDRAKKTRLWVGLGLSLLLGGSLVYSQRLKRIRDRKIHAQEKEIEAQKLKNIELENEKLESDLKFKQKELTAKVLQLARKNEFLQKLNREVSTLRDETEGEVKDTARKMVRMIDHDIEAETDWDDFLASFKQVHGSFLKGLLNDYRDLSKTDLRLACLMKMNLSSKEIAGVLNITPEGVKKARHRLRKKISLDQDVNIQEYLLGYPN